MNLVSEAANSFFHETIESNLSNSLPYKLPGWQGKITWPE
jgi:hypothetical protein